MAQGNDDTQPIGRIEYEQRHAALDTRVTRIETSMQSLATREDIQRLKTEIITEFSKLVPTSTDVDWLKWAVRATFVAAIGFGFGLALHLIGRI